MPNKTDAQTLTGGLEDLPAVEETLTGGLDDQSASIFEAERLSAPLPEEAGWKVGDIIADKYAVLETLGQGAMGIVYKVH